MQPLDRSLPLRTLIAAVLAGIAGLAIANAIVSILGEISVPSFSKYLLPVALEREMASLAEWSGAPGSATRTIWVAWFAVGAAGFAFPFLFNRLWFSRRIVSIPGITRVLATFAILGLIEYLTANAPGTLPVNAQGYEGWKPGEFGVGDFALRLVFGATGTAVFFVIVGETALGGSPDRWVNRQATQRTVAGAAAIGAIVGAVIAMVGELSSIAIPAILDSGYWLFNEAAEITRRGAERVATALSLTMALTTAAVGALLVALSPSPAGFRRRALAIAIAMLPAGAAVGTIFGYQRHIAKFGEARIANLAAAARLEPAPASRLLLLPGEKNPTAHLYKMEAKVLGVRDDEMIGATKGNLALVKNYLAERASRWTLHSLKAWDAEAAILDRLLEPDAAVRARLAAAEKTMSLIMIQLLAVRIPKMPVTPAVREVGDKLLDGARFLARTGDAKHRLAAIARNLGYAERAAELEDGAKAGGDVKVYSGIVNEARGPANGSISGRITIGGATPTPVRVALYRFPPDGKVRQPPLASINLLGGQDTGADGSFRFDGLRGGKYMIGVLLPEALGANPSVVRATGSLGPFDTAATPSIDAGTIDISRVGP
jgi:hypothetical protein